MRRRKRNGTWLPIIPTTFGDEPSTIDATWYETTLTWPQGNLSPGDSAQNAFPLTYDDSALQFNDDNASLRDKTEGQDYVLERIVGKGWFRNDGNAGESALREVIACLAFGVFPTTQEGGIALPEYEWNPLFAQNAQQPWIWRRTWRLSQTGVWTGGTGAFPISTAGYTGLDGGHIDTRGSKRRITKEHRVYIIAAAQVVVEDADVDPGVINQMSWGYDLRLFGGLRKPRNNSSF